MGERHADDVVVFLKADADDAAGLTAHGAGVGFWEADGHAFVRGDEDVVFAGGDHDFEEGVVFVEVDGDDSACARVAEEFERGLFDDAFGGDHENEFIFFFQIADGQERGYCFLAFKAEDVYDGASACGAAGFGEFVYFAPVEAAFVGRRACIGGWRR